MHLFATTQGGGNGVFASSLRRPDTRLSIVSAFLSARLSDLLSALLIWMIRFRCNWFTAICLPSLSIMSACLSVFVCSNADCNWFILCSVDCVCSLSVCVCGCLIINWSNWFIHQSLITPAYKDHPAPQPTAVLQFWWHDLWTFLWHFKYKWSELLFDDKYLIVSYQEAEAGICTGGLKQYNF